MLVGIQLTIRVELSEVYAVEALIQPLEFRENLLQET